jgi:hypothetical protein
MTGEILQAILDEIKAMIDGQGGTILLKTNYKPKDLPSYTMPLYLIHLVGAPESYEYPGGLTRQEWQWALNSYNYVPNEAVDDDKAYSTDLLNVVDQTRRHFANYAQFITPGMKTILDNYGLRMTYMGITDADVIDESGLEMGYKIDYDCVSFDSDTTALIDSTQVLEHVVQVNNPPFSDPA